MQIAWQRRIERAQELAKQSPVAPDILEYYQQVATFQASVTEDPPPANLDALRALTCHAPSDAMHAFYSRVLLQANAAGQPCARCDEMTVAAVERSAGRFLLCGMCFIEREAAFAECLKCGATSSPELHTDAEFPHIRVEACRDCRSYLKVIDLTRDSSAVPEVDELASVVLDLWAAENGYTKLQTNLFGM